MGTPALICDFCACTKKDNCVKCEAYSVEQVAEFCDNCKFLKKDNCVICDNYAGSNNTVARLCGSCSGFSKKCFSCSAEIF